MKLNDLITAFAEEIERARPFMEAQLDELSHLSLEDDRFLEALDNYNGQAQRMGEAAEMAGFSGLQLVCNHIVENTLILVALEPNQRAEVIDFLKLCPSMMIFYLENLDDPSGAAGLVDLLRAAPSPMETDQALKVTYLLGAIPMQVSTQSVVESAAQRPILASVDDVSISLPEDVDADLLNSFLQEAPNQTQQLVGLVQHMVSGDIQLTDLVAAKRVVHTLKGSSATVGIKGIASIGHHFEDILEHFESQEGEIPTHVASLMLDAAYVLEQTIDHLLGNDDHPEQIANVLQALLDTANRIDRGDDLSSGQLYRLGSGMNEQDAAPVKAAKTAETKPAATLLRVSSERIDELFRLSGDIMVQGTAIEARIKSLADTAKRLNLQNTRIQKRLFELENTISTHTHTLAYQAQSKGSKQGFDLLEFDEYSELHSATSALIEEVSDAHMYVNNTNQNIAELNGLQLQQQQSVKDLQYFVLSTRMAPVNSIEPRLQRNIRNSCKLTGKNVELALNGGDTLLDNDILTKLSEPLLHIIRNAVDHGIEMPDEREAQGKPTAGRISLTFARKGQQVELICEDDGRGLDHDAIFAKAVQQGLVAPDATMTKDEIAQLILHSGFTTRDEVTELSGRGVGLDVVRQWVEGINGTIRLSSAKSKGTRIQMQFAASLSTMQSLIVHVYEQNYAIPYVHIQQVLAKGVGEISQIEDKQLFQHNNQSMPFIPLARLLDEPIDPQKLPEEYDMVIAKIGQSQVALGVDALIDARDLLVKTPKYFAEHVQGITGLSILGDGSIAINLDLMNLLTDTQSSQATIQRTQVKVADKMRSMQPHIMIVDDALSVRNSLKQLIEDIGMIPITARDGMDAIEQLEENKPDVVLTDLEMPNLNGVELTSYIRNHSELKELPVVMITSRSQQKHKKLADDSGVDVFLTKPYNDVEVITLIQDFLKRGRKQTGESSMLESQTQEIV